jgi:hypothetical protein
VADIEQLLHRRSDLSTYLVHLTRGDDSTDAYDNLLNILDTCRLFARSAYGMARTVGSASFRATQRVVCLTETPLEHVWMMSESMTGRTVRLSPYGLAFSKAWARKKGVNPVWYIDITPGHDWLTKPLNELLDLARAGEAAELDDNGDVVGLSLERSQIARLAPFIEQMGPTRQSRKEFWWEREWRHRGTLTFTWSNVVAVFAPEAEHDDLDDELRKMQGGRRRRPSVLDPSWGLERMIAALAGLDERWVGPFSE